MNQPEPVSFREALRVWAQLGLLSFGGPAAQIAMMHREVVERRKWIDEERFQHALSFCMVLPGPEAQQLATYIGWLMHKTKGGLAAGALFVLPGSVAVLALSIVYVCFRQSSWVVGALFALQCGVLAIVVQALLRMAQKALKERWQRVLAVLSFALLYFCSVPFPLVLLCAAVVGTVRQRSKATQERKTPPLAAGSVPLRMAPNERREHSKPSGRRAILTLFIGVGLWVLPLAGLWLANRCCNAPGGVLLPVGVAFAQTAVVTFGGAYAVLTYVAQRAVHSLHWLTPGEMLDGLALAETTPGPLILVLQFVGFVASFRNPGTLSPLLAACLGAVLTVWVTFVPSFIWIFVGAPYIESLRTNRVMQRALSGITAAVVGVIANLSFWFAMHVVFHRVNERHWGLLRVSYPVLSSVNVPAVLLGALSCIAVFKYKLSTAKTLLLLSMVGVLGTMLVRGLRSVTA